MMDVLSRVRRAGRMLTRHGGFTAAAVLTLGLGIGATTTTFTIVDAIVLRDLPFGNADRLVQVQTVEPATGRVLSVSYPDYLDWRDASEPFEHLAAWGAQTFALTGAGPASQLDGELVSANYFDALGVEAAAGRTFVPGEDEAGAGPVAVIGDSLWRQRFGADPGVIGQTALLNDAPYEIVGVAPRGFAGFTGESDIWVPIGMFDRVNPTLRQYEILDYRATRWHSVVGALAPGRTIDEAEAALGVAAARLRQTYPEMNDGKDVRLVSAQEALVGDLRTPLLIVLGAAGFLLLVACANVATLLLARAPTRTREFAVHVALGAGRGEIVRQVLVESALLGASAAAVGLALAAWVVDVVMAVAPAEVPSFVRVDLDLRVVAFTVLVAAATTVAFGLAPALAMARRDPMPALRGGVVSGARRPLVSGQGVLVVIQLALALALEAGAGLMIRSVLEMQAFDPGFEAERLATMRISIPPERYPEGRAWPLLEEMRARLNALPGVRSTSFSSHVYFGGGYMTTAVLPETGAVAQDDEGWPIYWQFVGPAFAETLGIPVVEGRAIEERDGPDTPPVAMISESLAARLWPGASAVGRRLTFETGAEAPTWIEVVGVVADVRPRMTWGVSDEMPQVYTPMRQATSGGTPAVLLRADASAAGLLEPARRIVAEIDRDIPVFRQSTMTGLLGEQMGRARFVTLVLGIFALLALLLAAVGVYGVVSQMVAGRVREIGVRMALGARSRDVLGLVSRQAAVLTLVGAACGLVGAVVVTRLLGALLFGVAPGDALTFGVVTLVLTGVAAAAVYLPARRAARIDPLLALRAD